MTELFEHLSRQCPLQATLVQWNDPVLIVAGDNWSLSTTSSWRVLESGRYRAGSEDVEVDEWLRQMQSRSVVRFLALSTSAIPDIRVEFDRSLWLEVFVASRMEPWTLRLPHGPVIVPAPLDPEWMTRSRK